MNSDFAYLYLHCFQGEYKRYQKQSNISAWYTLIQNKHIVDIVALNSFSLHTNVYTGLGFLEINLEHVYLFNMAYKFG